MPVISIHGVRVFSVEVRHRPSVRAFVFRYKRQVYITYASERDSYVREMNWSNTAIIFKDRVDSYEANNG